MGFVEKGEPMIQTLERIENKRNRVQKKERGFGVGVGGEKDEL
jgi:hypothetical protein